MVRNSDDTKDLTKVSMSFIPSLRCNLKCSFCMYSASPSNDMELNYNDTKHFMATVDWGKVVGWGLYGGEPSIAMPLYQRFYELLPKALSKFVITNGTWSTDEVKLSEFLRWCTGKFHIILSGTPEHQKHQNLHIVDTLSTYQGVTLKGDDEMHPMGRMAKKDWDCTEKCVWHKQAIRLGIYPTGHIILQNCDGVYPIVGHIKADSFDEAFEVAVGLRTHGCDRENNLNSLREIEGVK